MKRSIIEKGFVFLCGSLFLGCSGQQGVVNLYPEHRSLSQDRLFLVEKPFANTQRAKTKSFSPMGTAILDVIAPELVTNMVDVVGQSLVKISGKDDQVKIKKASITDYFYHNNTYKTNNSENPAYHFVFVSAEFGEEKEVWRPHKFDVAAEEEFKHLNLVGKPKFYLEMSIVPILGTQYMEVIPTYFFYNTHLNPRGLDQRRDLQFRFTFSDINSVDTIFSSGTVVLEDVKVGEAYGPKELAGLKTGYLMMPQISSTKEGNSGGYTLQVEVVESRDIYEWLATLGEVISQSKDKISNKLYRTQEEQVIQKTALAKAKIEVRKLELEIQEEKTNNTSEILLLNLESQLLDKKEAANKLAIEYGQTLIYP